MTAPLTSPDCDCQGLPFMPLEVARFIDSDFTALSTGDEFKAAVILWAKSWTQVPAASIPDDDRILARWVGYSLAEWSALRTMALKNWVKCEDGRLYHPVIADLALKASAKRKGQADRANSRWAKAKAAQRADEMPPHGAKHAVASPEHAVAMQVKGTGKEKEPPLAPKGAGALFAAEPAQAEVPAVDEVRAAFDLWNETATLCGLPKAKVLDEARRRAIRKRLEVGGLDLWREAMAAVQVSAFLRGIRGGSGGRTFRADLTFVCQAKSFGKLIDGAYGQDADPPSTGALSEAPANPWTARVRGFAKNSYWNRLDWGPPPGHPGCAAPAEIQREFGVEPAPPQPIEGRAA